MPALQVPRDPPPPLVPTFSVPPIHRPFIVDPHPQRRFLTPWELIDKVGGRLPHWQQGHVVQFVTFRLADSLPEELISSWNEERRRWIEAHPKPWSHGQGRDYATRFPARMEQWLDRGHGSCLLGCSRAREALADCLMKSQPDDALHHAWVIMPNHVHLLTSPLKPLQQLVKQWKGVSSRALRAGSVWQRNYFDRMIRSQEHFEHVVRYIRSNPQGLPTNSFTLWESEDVKTL